MKAPILPLLGIAACLLPAAAFAQSTGTAPSAQPPAGHAVTVPLRPQAQPSAIDKALARPTILNPGLNPGEATRKDAPSERAATPAAAATATKTSPEPRKESAPTAAPAASASEGKPAQSAAKSEPAAAKPEPPVAQAETSPDAKGPAGKESLGEVDAKPKPKPTTLSVRVDLGRQQARISIDGRPTYTWAISSGRPGYDTPTGSFRPQWMSKLWYSKKYDDAPMPHSVFFNDGIAFHGTTSVRLLGRPASHGCIRLAPSNAATLFSLVQKHGMASTRIVVEGSTPAAVAAKREGSDRPSRRYAGDGPYGWPRGYAGRGAYAYAPGYPPGYFARPQMVWPGDSPWVGGGRYPRPYDGYGRRYY